MPANRLRGYDALAFTYAQRLAEYGQLLLPAVERLALDKLTPPARVLDVCCGTGRIAGALADRGYDVVGVDISIEMIRIAAATVPIHAVVGDARALPVRGAFDLAISTFDSLNHFTNLEELRQVLRQVRQALRHDALFVFDLKMAEDVGYWRSGCYATVEDQLVKILIATYDPENRIVHHENTLFRRDGNCWRRSGVTISQVWFTRDEVATELVDAGFTFSGAYWADRDLGLNGMAGRMFFVGAAS